MVQLQRPIYMVNGIKIKILLQKHNGLETYLLLLLMRMEKEVLMEQEVLK